MTAQQPTTPEAWQAMRMRNRRALERMTSPSYTVAPKLTGQQRDDIRRRIADGEDAKDLALEYGVSASTIRRTGAR